MPIGFSNSTTISMSNITDITNVTDPTEFFINVNHIIYGGWLYFILLIVLWAIYVYASQQVENQILTNIMYGGALVSVISLLIRAIEIRRSATVIEGLLTDYQMWIFPLITILIATTLWLSKRES